MDAETVGTRIREILSSVAEIDVESDDDDIFATGRLDSLSLVEVIFAIEQELGSAIALDDLDIDRFSSVRSIVALVASWEEKREVPTFFRAVETDEPKVSLVSRRSPPLA